MTCRFLPRFISAFFVLALNFAMPTVAGAQVTVDYRPDLGADSPKLDIYSFEGAQNAPVVIFVHGGTWQTGGRAQGPAKVRLFNSAGFVFVSIDYRLVPEVLIEDELVDVEYAFKWVHDNISKYGGNGRAIMLFGHSAGAHLVTMTAVAPRSVAQSMVADGSIRAVYSSDLHSYDFIRFGEFYNWNIPPAIKRAIGTDRDRIRTLSPLLQIRQNTRIPPFLLSYSSQPSLPLRRETTLEFAAAIQRAGGVARVIDGTRYNHKTIIWAIGNQPEISNAVVSFFQQYTGN